MAQSLTNAIANGKDRATSSKAAIAAATQELGEARNERMETAKNQKADEAYLASLTSDCTSAHEAWDARQQEAKDEVGALTKAKEILSSRVRVTGFVQIHGNAPAGDDDEPSPAESQAREAVLGKLRDLSHKFNSYALMEMVSAAATDPFEKIRGLISDMIAKLVAEANQEATQKAFCDEEISKSKASQSKKSMTIDKLTSRIDSASAKKAELADSIKALEGEIADLDKATTEATTLRGEEHASFLKES